MAGSLLLRAVSWNPMSLIGDRADDVSQELQNCGLILLQGTCRRTKDSVAKFVQQSHMHFCFGYGNVGAGFCKANKSTGVSIFCTRDSFRRGKLLAFLTIVQPAVTCHPLTAS